MGLPTPPSDGGIGLFEWGVGAFSGGIGALVTAGLFIWRRATKEAGIVAAIAQHTRDIDELQDRQDAFDAAMKELADKNDKRHEENLKALRDLPDMTDFRRLEDRLDKNFDELKKIVSQTAR